MSCISTHCCLIRLDWLDGIKVSLLEPVYIFTALVMGDGVADSTFDLCLLDAACFSIALQRFPEHILKSRFC